MSASQSGSASVTRRSLVSREQPDRKNLLQRGSNPRRTCERFNCWTRVCQRLMAASDLDRCQCIDSLRAVCLLRSTAKLSQINSSLEFPLSRWPQLCWYRYGRPGRCSLFTRRSESPGSARGVTLDRDLSVVLHNNPSDSEVLSLSTTGYKGERGGRCLRPNNYDVAW